MSEDARPDAGELREPEEPGARPQQAKAGTWIDFLVRCLVATLTGVCMFLAAPNMNLWWVGFFSWLPWLWAIDGQRPFRAFFIGWAAGVMGIFLGYIWMTELLTRFAGFPLAGATFVHFLFSFWQGAHWAIAAALLTYLQKKTGRSTLILFPLVWAGIEMVLPALFPTYLAFMWCWHPVWIQTAEIAGVATVSFVQAGISASVWEVLRAYSKETRFDRRGAIAFASWMIVVPSYGAIRMAMVDAVIETRPKLQIGVVQGNFGIFTYGSRAAKRRILADLQRTSARLEAEGADLLLWGETAYPYGGILRDSKGDFPLHNKRRIRREFEGPLILGAMVRSREKHEPYPFNTALVLHPDGTFGDSYDKVYPLAFGEAAPWPIDPEWYLDMVPSASHIAVGEGEEILEVANYRFGPLICYEDILPTYARRVGNLGVHAFVNLTNDSWFGNSAEQHEHLGLAVFRAVEHRRPLLRAVNAGVSAYVDPAGRVVHRTLVTDSDTEGYRDPVGFVADVPMMDPTGRTPYARFGPLWVVLIWGTIVGLWIVAVRSGSGSGSRSGSGSGSGSG